jgi:hypothetical protein
LFSVFAAGEVALVEGFGEGLGEGPDLVEGEAAALSESAKVVAKGDVGWDCHLALISQVLIRRQLLGVFVWKLQRNKALIIKSSELAFQVVHTKIRS